MPTNLIANLRINTAPAFRDIDAFKSKIGGRTFSQPLGRISGDAAEFSKSLQAAAARVTAFGATTGAIYAVSKAISETAKSTIEVNKQLVELNTFLGASQVTLDKFGKTLFDISRLTATPFGEVAEAAKEFARQGLSLEETSKRTKDALILARVAGIGYGQAVNGITTSINSFNKEALDSTVIINKLIAVDTRFAVSAKDINEAFVRVGSAAEEAGISSSKLVAAITAAQQVTGRGGAVIGNALKTIFTRLQRTEVIDQLKDIGVAVSDQSGKLLDGIEILKNYANATRTLSQAEKNRADELLGGVYQINQLQGLVKDLTSANSVYTNALRAASTATDEATKKNEELNKSLSARLSALSSTALQAGADIGKNILTPLMDVGISFSEIMLKALSPENYSDQADKTGKVIGDSLGKNVSKGFGQFLVVAGAPLAAAFGFAISKRLLSFGKDAIGSQLKSINAPLTRVFEGKPFFEKDYERQLNLQNQITEAVIKSGAASGMTIGNVRQEAAARRILLQYLKQENQELERKYSLTQQATSYLSQRGVETVSQVRFQPRNARTGRFTRAASGYVPNFSMSEADQEIVQAKGFGAKNPKPKIIQATIKGKTQPVMVNNEEDVIPNFAGTGETAIIPRYRKMQDIPRMSEGYVPNFAQKISSADTSLNQIPALFKKFGAQLGPRNIDIGGGKYNKGTNFLKKEFGIFSRVHDKYNRSEKFNEETFKQLYGSADTATVANVLNVIEEKSAREELLQFVKKSIKPGGSAYFGIYEGDRSGVGTPTKKGYQRNLTADAYLEEISKYFDVKKKTGNYIIGTPLASGYVPNFAFDTGKTWYTRDRKIVDPQTYSYLRYALTEDKKAIKLVFSKSEQKGQGWQMFERLGKTAKRIGLPVKSDVLSSQANDVLDISDASLAKAGKYGIDEVLKVAYPQLLHRQKGSSKNTSLSVITDDGMSNTSDALSGKNIFSIVSGFASRKYNDNAKLLRNSIIDGSFGLENVITNFAGGRVPNFAASKFVQNIVNSYKASLTEKDAVRLGQAEKAASYYPIVNSELKALSGSSGIGLETLAYSLAALSGNTSDLDARRGLERIIKNQPYDDLAILPKNVEKVKKMMASSGSTTELMSILGKGAKTQNFAQSLLLSENFSGFGKYKNPIGTPSVMDSWAIYVRNGGALKDKYDRKAVSEKQKRKLFSQSASGYKYYNKLVKEYAEASKILGVPVRDLQARTWGWARGQMGSVTRNSFASGYVPNFAKILIAAKYYDSLKVGKAKGVEISKTGEVKNVGREVFGGIGFSTSRIGKGFASAVRTTSPTTALRKISEQAGVTKSIIVPVVASSAVNDPVPDNLKTNEALLQQFLANHPQPKEVVASLSQQGFDVKSILRSHSGSEIKSIIDILSSNSFNKGILTKSANELKDPKLVKFFAPGGIKAKGPKGTYAFGSSIAEMQQGEYASKILGKHKSYPILVTGKSGPEISEPINAEEIFPGITNNKNRLFFSSVYQFGTRVLDTDNPDHMKILAKLGYSEKTLLAEKLMAGGYIPNFAGLSNAISREKTMSGLPVSQIMAHFDGKGNPIAVTNKRDEPNGLRDVPNFAVKMPKITPQNLAAFNEILGAVIGGVTSITNVMAQNETINLDTAQNLNVAASGLSAAIGVIVGNKTLGKNATFGQRALATALPLVTAGISGGIGYLGSKQVEKGIEQQKIQRESERVAQQFSDLTNNTQELSDTLAKLDAAYRDVSTNPEELLKLTKRSTELTTRISKTNPELAAKLAGEPNVGRRIDIIQENNKIAANQQAVEQEILGLRSKPKISNEELIASFSKQIGSVGENIFKTKEGSVNEANLPKFLEENKLTKLSDFFKEQDQALQSKLRPAFIAALNSQLKLNNEAIKYNKEIIRIQGDLFKFRSKVESARELRKVSLDTRIAGVEGLQDFSQNFGARAAISAKADTFKIIEGLKPINQFRQAVNAQVRNDQLGFSKEITNKLLSIQGPGDIAKKQLEEISKTAGLTEDQKDAINKLITQNETSTKELQKISNISEINKKNQERLLSIQERLGYGGGIKSSIDARSRVETMNAPLRGALEYQIGGALGSPRSQIAGRVNFLKSIQQLYPGLVDKTGGLDATSRSLSALRMGDLQRDLLRNSSIANQMGLTDVAEELRKKAFDPKSLAEIARTQTEAELQTGKTPSDVAEELRGVFKEFTDSLSQTFKEEAEIRKKEKEVAPEQQAATKVFQDLSKELQTKIEAAFKDAFGVEGISFKNPTIKAENAVVNITPAPNQDKAQESTSSGTQQARAAMGTIGGYSKGFIPSFYNPLREAIKRENQYVPLSSIRVNKSNKLVNQDNPFGLAVTNTFDEPNGLKDVGLFSRGFIPNFAAFGSKVASEARRNAKLGKLYVWDNIDNGFRKVNPSGTVETDLIDRKNLPKGAKVISTELSQGGKKSIIPLKDPKVTKLDELKLPGIARSQSIDGVISRLDKQGRLTPRNLLREINKISGGKDVVVKTAFGESNVQSKGVYGLGRSLNTADARSIIGKYRRGTGSGFFTQEKVPTYYNELRVHVAVDDKGNVKIIKGGTVLKATGFDPTAGPSIKAYTDAGLSKNEAIKMAKSFRRAAEAAAFDAIRALGKTKGTKNAVFGVDVGGTTLQSALDAGVKTREFYSGGRGRVGTIVFEVNPSDKGGSTGFMGRGLSEKLVRNIFGEKPAPSGLTTGSPAIGINPTGSPAYPPPTRPSLSSSGAPLGPGLPSGFSSKPSLASSIVNAVKNQATLTKNSFATGFQNIAGKASGFGANLMSGAKGFGSNLMSFGKNALGKAGTGLTIAGSLGLGQEAYEALKRGEFGNAAVYGGASVGLGVGALNSIFGSKPVFNSKANRYVDPKTGRFTSAPKASGFGKFAGGASGIASALLSGAQMVGEIKNKQYGNAAVSGAQTALYIASALSKKATGAFGIASGLGLAKDIANAKNFELASDWSDVLFGKAEQGGGIVDLVGTALTAASGPIGAGVATAKIGYRIGNVIENKLGLGDKLGNAMAGSEAAARAEFASLGMAKSITKKDVVEGKQSASKYIESKRRDLEELSKAGAFKGDVIDTLNKDLDQISSRRKEREKAIEEKSRTDAIIAKRAEETKAREAGFKAEDEKRKEDQNKFDASLRRKIIEGITKNEDLSGLKTSRDRSLYLLELEKNFGKFTEQDFGGDKSLYDSYKNYSKESEATKKKEDKFNKEIMNPEAAGGEAYRIQQFREEQQRNADELSSLPKDAFEEAARRRITAEQVMEERKKLKNKSGGFIPNFAYSRERLSVLTSPDYAGYRNAVPEPSKYYKNVVKNTAEIEVPASEVYNRMGLFGAQPKNASEKYAILNPAQQAQLGYAANGFIPNFAPEQFAGAISEALQQALSPMMERMGSSVSNSNVINVNDQRSFDMTSDKVNGVMEFLQKQFPTQFARQMGPKKV